MATSGTLTTTAWKGNHGTRYLELSWEKVGFSVVNRTTTIKWTLTAKGTYTGYVAAAPFTVEIDGARVYYSETRIKLYPEQVIASGEKVISHNADGTKTFTASVKAAIYWSSINATGSQNYELDLVGMASIITAPNFTDEDNPTIEYYNPVGNAITSLQAAISLTGADVDIAYRDIAITGNRYTFNLTEEERKVLRAATVGSNERRVRFYLRNVVEGGIYFNWYEVYFTVIKAAPTIEVGVIDTNSATTALTGSPTTLIRYHSTASASMSAYAYKEATIASKRIEHNGSTTTEYVAIYPNVEGNVFSFAATDSRNNTATETVVAPMIDYIKPSANIANSSQIDTNGNYSVSCEGNYYNDTFGYTDAAAANTLTVEYRYKPQGGTWGSWQSMAATISGNTYNATATATGLDYRTAYVFQCRAIDKLNTINSVEITVRSLPVFHWSENDFVFEVPVEFKQGATGVEGGTSGSGSNHLEGDVYITGNLRMKGDGNYGNTIYFGDSSYAYITELTDDDITIKATDINLQGNVSINGMTMASTTWTPRLTGAEILSYTEQAGWAMRLGNVVTVGWNIKALVAAGYSDVGLVIDGLPYQPQYAAFGGGVAHNIYITNNFCFEGWCIGTNGRITPRLQPCNPTTAGNLNISSTAYYPTGNSSNTVTVAGTVSFIIAG